MAATSRPTKRDGVRSRPLRAWRSMPTLLVLLAAIASLSLAALPSCKEAPDRAEVGYGLEETGTSTGFQGKMKHRCELDEEVSAPAEGTAEYAVHQAVSAALTVTGQVESDEGAFSQFFSQFARDKKEDWVRSQYWKAARKNAAKFVPKEWAAGSPVVLRICTREEQGEGQLRLTLLSYDPDKNNHPIKLQQDDAGKWRLVAWSP